jgi:hypothetical protein
MIDHLYKNFSHEYIVQVRLTSDKDKSSCVPSIILSYLSFRFILINDQIILREIKANNEVYGLSVGYFDYLDYGALSVSLYKNSFEIELGSVGRIEIVKQLKFIALNLERNPDLWFKTDRSF